MHELLEHWKVLERPSNSMPKAVGGENWFYQKNYAQLKLVHFAYFEVD